MLLLFENCTDVNRNSLHTKNMNFHRDHHYYLHHINVQLLLVFITLVGHVQHLLKKMSRLCCATRKVSKHWFGDGLIKISEGNAKQIITVTFLVLLTV